jgi:hypothetical protein
MKLSLITSTLALVGCVAWHHPAKADPQLEEVAKQKIGAFSAELKATLKQAISNGGPVKGIVACREEAPLIAAKHSVDGWQIARRSNKNRNIANKPDDWEQQQIHKYAEALAAGSNPETLSSSEKNSTEFRFAKPILMDTMCLACHGTYLSDDVKNALKQQYPQDLATGFTPGELRGIFSVKKRLP